ncbi:hypothetical protein HMPREF1983_01137 [Gemella bergeri ATCC 700627]|uniref:Uncharacterized protein n=1 Tax=Gemella bergeri ATCC 700627 TaxID=1321820 RepID=U2Q3I8_9BACL|nr:hypothetical protein HMPREF1983_01137 [Gemella bergeri ATCC 700627]
MAISSIFFTSFLFLNLLFVIVKTSLFTFLYYLIFSSSLPYILLNFVPYFSGLFLSFLPLLFIKMVIIVFFDFYGCLLCS